MRALWVTTAAAAVLLAGCAGTDAAVGPSPTPSITSPTPTASASPTPTPTPTPTLSPEEQELAAAITAVERFIDVRVDLSRSHDSDLNRINDVAFSPARQEQIDAVIKRDEKGFWSKATQRSMTRPRGRVEGGVWVRGCLDSSGLTVVDTDGNVVLAPEDRQPRSSLRWLVVYDESSDGWYVSEEHTIWEDATPPNPEAMLTQTRIARAVLAALLGSQGSAHPRVPPTGGATCAK